MEQKHFYDFDFHDLLLDGIDAMGYEYATPVQAQVIPAILEGRDIIAAAQTGTGKTAAFLLPLIEKLLSTPHEQNTINAMVIVPTRELAVQISQVLEGLAYYTDISSIAIYGGSGGEVFATEKKALSTGADIVICTPGRMIAHLNMGYVKLAGLKYLVLDEADRMLDMGFYEDIIKIIQEMPKDRQNLMFSATMPPAIRKLANTILRNPAEISIAISKPPEQIVQHVFYVFDAQKIPLVKHVLQNGKFESVIVFCSSKSSVKKLTETLKRAKFSVDEIHSDLEQDKREQVLIDFKSKKLKILVATDILSRGIHIEDVDLVINYDIPHDGEDYVHRIGRTARAASKGTALTFVGDKEQYKFRKIEQLLGKPVERGIVPPELGPVPDPGQDPGRPPKKKHNKFKRRK
ncbi:MAG: DEAD/DEAH box helicase [Flavipsychrobacter sp.]|nr:DEAD/DEAH box helicase [Flavipsychrobacter sp.]